MYPNTSTPLHQVTRLLSKVPCQNGLGKVIASVFSLIVILMFYGIVNEFDEVGLIAGGTGMCVPSMVLRQRLTNVCH